MFPTSAGGAAGGTPILKWSEIGGERGGQEQKAPEKKIAVWKGRSRLLQTKFSSAKDLSERAKDNHEGHFRDFWLG